MSTRLRRTTIVEVLDLALELERKTMALYASFVSAFEEDDEVRHFWFNMARGEAAHCGALMLLERLVRDNPVLHGDTKLRFDMSTGVRLRSLLVAYRREQRRGVTLERAFEMALDLEGSELEDLVVDLLQVVSDPGWRAQSVQMLLHDMADLSYMIERHTDNKALLARADALVEARATGRDAQDRASGGSTPNIPRDSHG